MISKRFTRFILFLVVFFLSASSIPQVATAQSLQPILTPGQHFGFQPGADRFLLDYEELISYLQNLDLASPKLKMVEIGKSPMGRTMYIAFISSEQNIKNLDQLKKINHKLALDPNLSETERASLFKDGKVFFLATLSMHSGEVAPAQAAPLIAHQLLTTDDPQILKWLDDVVYMMVPNHNPDGMDLVVHHYRKYKDTKYEGGSLPGVYHKYVGHDNNRDFVTLTQEDTRAISGIFSQDWFPQVMIEKHQMGSTGPRYFVPPMHDPIAENIDANLWNWTKIFGSNMITDMTEAGLAGVCHSCIFDDYWPGSTETCIWKNVIGMLTEMASIKYATPIFIEPNELSVYGKGLSEYKKSINMPLPWPGGWWRLSEMLEYEIESTMSILKTASRYRKEILELRNDLCRKEVQNGRTKPPYYYVLPINQHDQSELVGLVNLLREHGVKVYRLSSSAMVGDKSFAAGDIVVPLAQPFRPFIKEVMEKQQFPLRHYTPNGKIIRPYDITSWSLPLHRGVKAIEVHNRADDFEHFLREIEQDFTLAKEVQPNFEAAIFNAKNNESFKAVFQALKQGLKVERFNSKANLNGETIPKGSFIINNDPQLRTIIKGLTTGPMILNEPVTLETTPLNLPRIALVETFFHDMDAGWTRFVFDSYSIPFTVVHPGDFEKTDFSKNFDMIVFPDVDKSILMEGKYKSRDRYYISDYPPEYTKGIGKKGKEKLMTFLDKGGIIVSWGRSTGLFMGKLEIVRGKDDKEEFQLPVRDISENIQKAGLFCPGSLMKTVLRQDHPLTYGMPKEIGVFFRGRPVFTTSIPNFDMDRRVIGKFLERDILMSGYCEKQEKVGNKSNLVWLKKGKGQLVLFGFNPQFRASTQVAFKLLFNAVLLPKIK